MLVSCRGPGLGDSIVETIWRIYACSSGISTNSSGKSLLAKRRSAMDPLTDILHDLRLESSFYARSELRVPWGLSFSVRDGPSFHVIVTGRAFLRIDAERIPLGTGDLVLLPHGEEHQLADPAESAAIPLAAL